MSTRTPGLQPRSQYHSYWGIYANGSTLLPNQSANPLASPGEFDKLEEGDIAYSNDTGNEGLYVCTDPGGAAATPAATWVMLAMGGAVVQTIRDAHQIVVGQDTLAPYSDVVAIDADFVDDGSGIQLQAALTAAAALIVGARSGVDVRLRPCSIGPAAPLTMDSNIKLIGADRDDCTLSVNAGGVLSLIGGVNNVIEGISFGNSGDGPEGGVLFVGPVGSVAGVEIRRCRFFSDNSNALNTLAAIFTDTNTVYDLTVEENEFELNGIVNGVGDRVGICLSTPAVSLTNSGAIRFCDNRVLFGDMAEFVVTSAGESANPIEVSRNVHGAAGTAGGNAPLRFFFDAPAPSPGQGIFPGPVIEGNSIRMSVGSYVGTAPQSIVRIEALSGNNRALRDINVSDNVFVGSTNSESGVVIANNASPGAASVIEGVVVTGNNIRVDAANAAVEVRQGNAGYLGVEAIRFVSISGNSMSGAVDAVLLAKLAAPGQGLIQKVAITGNSGDSSGGNTVSSNSSDITDATIVGNAFVGFAVVDPSGTFEVAHNV